MSKATKEIPSYWPPEACLFVVRSLDDQASLESNRWWFRFKTYESSKGTERATVGAFAAELLRRFPEVQPESVSIDTVNTHIGTILHHCNFKLRDPGV